MQSQRLYSAVAFLFLAAFPICAQQAPASQPSTPAFAVNNDFIQKQFGSSCSKVDGPGPFIKDMNGDGIEDIVIVARCINPLIDQTEDKFTVIDPYNSFFGYGNTKITSQFASEDPKNRALVLLVIHGAGADAWRSAEPKEKFVIINLPFKQILVKKLTIKKKSYMAIFAEETGGDQMTSATYWDGKKYKYGPLGSSLQ